jgi:ATP-dependent DNA helicase RecQ
LPSGQAIIRGLCEGDPLNLRPKLFTFAAGEVRLHTIYRHLKLDEVTGNVREDWFVPIPQIQVCR